MKTNENENVTTEELLKRGLHEFLDVYMSIPSSTVSRMEIKNISHGQHIDFETVTVEFSSMCSVTTVFKYVKNLAAEQKVSIVIPQALEQKNEDLREWSFLMRTEEPKHKTVIKYIGNNLVMYAKKVSGGSWFLVNHPPQIPHPSKDGPQNAQEMKKVQTLLKTHLRK